MRIITTTQTHNAEHLIGDALRSALPFADACLVVTSCPITDGTIRVAREVVGDRLVLRHFDWDGDFSAARNYHLDVAQRLGYDWAVTLDTDERLHGLEHRHMAETEADALFVAPADRTYMKLRCFRLPVRGKWTGKIHERFAQDVGAVLHDVPGATFTEVPKLKEQLDAKFRNVVDVCGAEVVRGVEVQRNLYYLGDAYACLGNDSRAASVFHDCAFVDSTGWAEERAWAMYRRCECLGRLGNWQLAREAAIDGMKIHPGIGELLWAAAFASFHLGDVQAAVCWALMAVPLGRYVGVARDIYRCGFTKPDVLWEGPFDVLRNAYRVIGDQAAADNYEAMYQAALAKRLGGGK